MCIVYDLKPIDGRKSFYGKAKVVFDNGMISLVSYQTTVCCFNSFTLEFTRLWSGYSATTMRHINAFLQQYELPGGGKAWWTSLTPGIPVKMGA